MDPLLELGLYLKAGQRELERQMNEVMRPLGLTAPQADALLVIARTEPISLRDLGDLVIAESGHPSRLVDRLVEAGLIQRQADPDDRRRIELTLTVPGRRLEKKVRRARDEVLDHWRVLLRNHDLDPVLELLREMAQPTPIADLVGRRRAFED